MPRYIFIRGRMGVIRRISSDTAAIRRAGPTEQVYRVRKRFRLPKAYSIPLLVKKKKLKKLR